MSDIKQAVHDQFSKTADNYRTSTVHAAGEDLTAIARLVAQHNAPIVLDAGCGAGHTAINVAPHSAQVIAFDLSAQMLDQVQRLAGERGLSNVQTRQGDVETVFAHSRRRFDRQQCLGKLPRDIFGGAQQVERQSRGRFWPYAGQALKGQYQVLQRSR